MFARLLVCAMLIGTFGVAGAQRPASSQQQSATKQLTPEQRAAIRKQNQVLVQYADSIVAMIDNGQVGQVWDQASRAAKQSVSREQFVKATEADRTRLGKMKSRRLAAVTRSLVKGGKLPAGYYVNVNFATRFDNQAQPIRELVSFHLDGDRKWRLSGYTVH